MTLAKGFDANVFQVIEFKVEQDATRDVIVLELLDNGGLDTCLIHPQGYLIGCPCARVFLVPLILRCGKGSWHVRDRGRCNLMEGVSESSIDCQVRLPRNYG
jgi:hypothetical protein